MAAIASRLSITEGILELSLNDSDIALESSSITTPVRPSTQHHTSTRSVSSVASDDQSITSVPRPPPRSPLRRISVMDIRRTSINATDKVGALFSEVTSLLNKIYEIEELRHSSSSCTVHSSRLNELLLQVDRMVTELAPQLAMVDETVSEPYGSIERLRADWEKAVSQHRLLKEELNDDAWLVRFRTTADQAEGMMDPLQASLAELTHYVGRILSSLEPSSAKDDQLSMERLTAMSASHQRLKNTYVPSVTKILRMMETSVFGRAAKNGEALRRLSDMSQRWTTLLKQLEQLEAKIALVHTQHDSTRSQYEKVEMLADTDEGLAHELFYPAPKYAPHAFGEANFHPSQMNPLSPPSTMSYVSSHTYSPTHSLRGTPGSSIPRPPSAASAARPLRSPPDMPRWNSSTKPLRDVVSYPPSSRRMSSSHAGLRVTSPTPSNMSASATSRIPLRSPRQSFNGAPQGPVWTSTGAKTPSGSSRISLSRGPPSSFHLTSPNPTAPSTPSMVVSRSRPSSRMSVASMGGVVGGSGFTTPSVQQPFEPSKYDLLDLEVQRVLDAVQPAIFVSRLDAPLRRGQRRGEGESWTGEFVFGSGEKSTSVKLLELAGKGVGGVKRVKCMVRVGGAWQDLAAFLMTKKHSDKLH